VQAAENRSPPPLVSTLCVGMNTQTLCVSCINRTQSVQICVPTQSIGTRRGGERLQEEIMDAADSRLLIKVCKQYFEDGLTQQKVAGNLRTSRSTVSRLLSKAREQRIVRISIKVPPGIYPELEKALEQRFDLVEAVVVETANYDAPFSVARELGGAAASYLDRASQPGDIIGFAWGTTMKAMVDAIQRKVTPDVKVVQMNGGLTPQMTDLHATSLTRDLAARLGAACYILQSPGVVGAAQTQHLLMADAQVSQVFEIAAQANLAFIGIGSMSADALWRRAGLLTEEVTAELQSLGAVGDIMSRYYDREGRMVNSSLCQRVVGLPIEQLRQINRRVGVAGGKDKFEAILGALYGKYVNVLITDHITAQNLIDSHQEGAMEKSV